MRQAYELLLLCYGKASNVKDKKKQTNKNTQTNRQTKPKQKKIYKRASEENNTYAQ